MSSKENKSRSGLKDKYFQLDSIGIWGLSSVYAGNQISNCLQVIIKRFRTDEVSLKWLPMERCFNDDLEVALILKAAGLAGSVGKSSAVTLLDWYIVKDKLILLMEKNAWSKDPKTSSKNMEDPLMNLTSKNMEDPLMNLINSTWRKNATPPLTKTRWWR